MSNIINILSALHISDEKIFSKITNTIDMTEEQFNTLDVGINKFLNNYTYVYTVTGADTAEVNGNYWENGTLNGYPAYTNDKYWLVCINIGYNTWAFFASKPAEGVNTGYVYCKKSDSDVLTPIDNGTNYYTADLITKTSIIVAEYSGSSSGMALRIISPKADKGCAQIYKLTSGDTSSPPYKSFNPWVFTGVTDTSWTITINCWEEPPSVYIVVGQTIYNKYYAYSNPYYTGWVSLADTVSKIINWDKYGTNDPILMNLRVVDSNGKSSDNSGDSGTGDKTYVYTVSGADIAEANGNYYQDGTLNGYPAYTNGTYWLIRATSAYNNWAFFAVKPPEGTYTGYAYYKSEGDSSTPIDNASNYRDVTSNARTSTVVTEYSGSSSIG